QRRDVVLVLDVDVGARLEQQLDGFHVVPMGRPMQRRGPVGLRRVHVGVLFEQSANRRFVLLFGRVRQQVPATAGRGGGESQTGDGQNQPCAPTQDHVASH